MAMVMAMDTAKVQKRCLRSNRKEIRFYAGNKRPKKYFSF